MNIAIVEETFNLKLTNKKYFKLIIKNINILRIKYILKH